MASILTLRGIPPRWGICWVVFRLYPAQYGDDAPGTLQSTDEGSCSVLELLLPLTATESATIESVKCNARHREKLADLNCHSKAPTRAFNSRAFMCSIFEAVGHYVP